jgi:hypothetical protein
VSYHPPADPFRPGPLSREQAVELNRMAEWVRWMTGLTVERPLELDATAGNPSLRVGNLGELPGAVSFPGPVTIGTDASDSLTIIEGPVILTGSPSPVPILVTLPPSPPVGGYDWDDYPIIYVKNPDTVNIRVIIEIKKTTDNRILVLVNPGPGPIVLIPTPSPYPDQNRLRTIGGLPIVLRAGDMIQLRWAPEFGAWVPIFPAPSPQGNSEVMWILCGDVTVSGAGPRRLFEPAPSAGSRVVWDNTLGTGQTFRIDARGRISTASSGEAGALTLTLTAGGDTTLCTIGPLTLPLSLIDCPWWFAGLVTCRDVLAGVAKMQSQHCRFHLLSAGQGTADLTWTGGGDGTVDLDATRANLLDLYGELALGTDPTNVIVTAQATIERLRAEGLTQSLEATTTVTLPDATQFPDLFNTGVNGSNVRMPADCGTDIHWTLAGVGPTRATDGNANWPSWDDDASQWLTPLGQCDGSTASATTSDYTLTFTMPAAANPDTFKLQFRFMQDLNLLDVLVNGVSNGIAADYFDPITGNEWKSATLTRGFLPGVNTIVVRVYDDGIVGGVRVEWQQASWT